MHGMKRRMLTGLLTLCLIFVLASPFVSAADEGAIVFREIGDRQYFLLDDLSACSDITVEPADNGIYLIEDGMRIQLMTDSLFVYRDGCIVASMSHTPILHDGLWYASSDFYEEFLCRGTSDTPSLFNGTLFYPDEVLSALYATKHSAYNQKLLAAISLPVSMSIKEPHIDMERVFIKTHLSEYPAALASEMQKLGYENAGTLAYSEYKVITGAQSLVSAGITPSYPELQDVDPAKMTVAQYIVWQRSYHAQQFEESLSDLLLEFMTKKRITVSDLSYLNKYFYGSYTEQTDDALMEALIEHYATDINYLKTLVNPFSDIKDSSWYFNDVMFVYSQNIMTGTSASTFDPNGMVTRGEIVIILWRLEGRPAVNYAMSYDDVDEGMYYGEAVRWASAESIVSGNGNGGFGPGDAITREQLAAILWRYAKNKTYDVSVGEDERVLNHDDALDVSEYAVPAMQWAYARGVVNGTTASRLSPQEKATRAQAAAIFQRFCQLVNAD